MQNNPNDSFGLGPNAATLSYPAQQMLLAQYAGKMQNGQLYNHPQWADWGDRMRRSGMIYHPSMPSGGVRQGPTIDDLIFRVPPGQDAATYKPRMDYLPFQVPSGKQYDPMAARVNYAAYKPRATPGTTKPQASAQMMRLKPLPMPPPAKLKPVAVTFEQVYAAAKAAGDPHPYVTAAQWALELGNGKHTSGRFNYFGVKGPGTVVPTTEYINGHRTHTKASFRDYGSLNEGIADHTRLLKSQRYSGYGAANTDEAAVQALVRSGCATDPNYAKKLQSIIKSHRGSKR